MYAVKSDAERGPVGAWAVRARRAAGYQTAAEAVREANLRGVKVSLPHLQGIEAGSDRAGAYLLEQLADMYGSEPPVTRPEVPDDLHALARALEERLDRQERLLRLLLERLGGDPSDRGLPQ